jgi:hypothetical protein
MRPYPQNSSQAAARIVALAMIADGQVAPSEVDSLDRLDASARLGLGHADMVGAVRSLCIDLLTVSPLTWADACRLDPRTLAALLAEIDDPAMRETVLELCLAVVEADAHIADGEEIVVSALVEQWGLQHAMFAPRAQPATAAAN